MINLYNDLIEQIVEEFAKRYYKECFNEDEYDYEIMDYKWIKEWPVEICDEFYSICDILMTIKHNIPLKIVRERYNKSLDAHMEDKPFKYNLWNYWQIKTNHKEYEKQEKESLKKSEENLIKARDLLNEILINN